MSFLSTRRTYRRISTNYPGCYLTSNSVQRVVVRDISLNGLRLEGYTNHPYDSLVTIRLWLPNGDGMIDIDQAVVRWKTEQDFGVQIVTLSNESDLRLARHVEQRLQQMAPSAAFPIS